MCKMYIRPNYCRGELKAYTLTRSPSELLIDYAVVAHFDLNHNGKEIREVAAEFYGATNVLWASPIYND